MTDDNHDLTPGEPGLHSGLPREADPPPALEERVVGALRSEGLLRSPFARSVRISWPVAIAASLVVFAAGVVAGRVIALGRGPVAPAATAAPNGGIRVVISM